MDLLVQILFVFGLLGSLLWLCGVYVLYRRTAEELEISKGITQAALEAREGRRTRIKELESAIVSVYQVEFVLHVNEGVVAAAWSKLWKQINEEAGRPK